MLEKSSRPAIYFNVLDACAAPGCPLCRLAETAVTQHIDTILYEFVNDLGVREELRRSLGYCYQHAWQMLDRAGGHSLGVAILFRDVLNHVATQLEQMPYEPTGHLSWRRVQEELHRREPAAASETAVHRLQPDVPCPICVHRDEQVDRVVTTLDDALAEEDEQMLAALQASDGLCLPHLRRAIALCRSETAFSILQATAGEKLAALLGELDEFIRKNDYRFLSEGFGPEGDSWRRAVIWTVGREFA